MRPVRSVQGFQDPEAADPILAGGVNSVVSAATELRRRPRHGWGSGDGPPHRATGRGSQSIARGFLADQILGSRRGVSREPSPATPFYRSVFLPVFIEFLV